MNHDSAVSIGFTVYNGASRMRPALDSLLSQTYKNFELIISDNASTDDTERICREYAARDSRIRYIRQPKNINQIPNYVFVLREARSSYFMWAADDDIWHRERVEKLVRALETHPNHDSAMCSYQNVYEDGIVQNTVLLKEKLNLTNNSYYSVYRKMISNRPIHHCFHGLHRREKIARYFYRPTPECIRWDRVFMAEVSLANRFVSVPELLFFKRATRTPLTERYKDDPAGKIYLDPFAYTKYVWMLLWRPMTSRPIPFFRKFFIPIVWFKVFWMYKRKMLQEFLQALKK